MDPKITMNWTTRKDLEAVVIEEAARQQAARDGELPEWWKAVDLYTASDTEVSILYCELLGY